MLRGILKEEQGQATLELAALLPVIIVVALIVINLGFYLEKCSQFDRVAPDVALAYGVSPDGEQTAENACHTISENITRALSDERFSVDVVCEKLDFADEGMFALNPARVRLVCTMHYKPEIARVCIAGVSAEAPFELTHTREVVADIGTLSLGVG